MITLRIPEKTICFADPDIERQLSSSYNFKEDLTKKAVLALEHHERLNSTKQELRKMKAMIQGLMARAQAADVRAQAANARAQAADGVILELKARAQAEDVIILDWETRDRLAQALNDLHVRDQNIHKEIYLLDYQGCGYLPFVLSAWALWWNCYPATQIQITDDEYRRHQRKASELRYKGLADAVDKIWYALPELDRSLMIAMWLGRRSGLRTPAVHPTPTTWEAQRVIASDPQLSGAEKGLALRLILNPLVVDRRNQRLFTGN